MTAGAATGVDEHGVDATAAGPVVAGHELLLRLAGRLPDDLLWRLRDWLAAGAHDSLAAVLPRALLRHRLGVTEHERDLLARCVDERSRSRRLVDAVLPLAGPDGPWAGFAAGDGLPDLAALSAVSVVSGHPGAEQLRQSLRGHPGHGPDADGRPGEQRVLLVLGAHRPWDLTATLQRLMRVHGDRTPCVEVLPAGTERPGYHRAALAGSALLWTAPARPADAAPAPGPETRPRTTGPPSGALTGT